MRFLLILSFLMATTLLACDDDSEKSNNTNNTNQTDPCLNYQCQENATCAVDQGVASCVCDAGFDLVEEECLNSDMVPCADEAPSNATSTSEDVEINYTDESGWSDPAPCLWTCDTGYTQEGELCVEEASVPLDGFGTLTGMCGVIDASHLESLDSFVFINTIDFGTDTYDASDYGLLSEGGQTLADTPNAGGSSQWSEVFSYELLYRCELADLLKTETEIVYDIEGSITDILVQIDNHKVGVSVTRAMSWPRDTAYDPAQAQSLLEGKLEGIQESTLNVAPEDAWSKQILHVLADRTEHVTVLEDALDQIDVSIIGDTIILISVTEGLDDFIYTNEI